MQPLYKNENLLFKDFQEFLSRKQHVPDKRLPYYLRWVSRFHEFCFRRNIDGDGKDSIAVYLQDLARDHEEWQVQQAKEAVRLYRYFKSLQASLPAEKDQAEGQPLWQSVEDEAVRALRLRHRSYRTEQSYLHWLRRFGAYTGFKEPQTVTQKDLEQFLSHLAVDGNVSSATQRVAFNALLFLFRHVLTTEIVGLDSAVRSLIPRRLPVVLTRQEVLRIFDKMEGTTRLMAGLIYRRRAPTPGVPATPGKRRGLREGMLDDPIRQGRQRPPEPSARESEGRSAAPSAKGKRALRRGSRKQHGRRLAP